MSTLGSLGFALAGLLAFNLLLRVARTAVRNRRVTRWVWKTSLPETLGSTRRKPGAKPTVLVAKGLAKFIERPLRVEPFEGGKDIDAAGVSSALSAAMTRIGSLRRSGVDSVTAPVAAASALDAIAAGVKAAPAGGELAAALLQIGWWLLARGELQLSGRVLESETAGPGLALTIATASGRTLERLTLWAWEYEPAVGESAGKHAASDRLMCIATAGAVWTHFTILGEVWHLREEELKQLLQTSVWRSYGFMQVGLEGKDHRNPDITRALYARAVDADPHNSVAQFNLASLELDDHWFDDVRAAGLLRLTRVHDELDGHRLPSPGPAGSTSCRERQQLLLNRDPLHYQVAYKRGATKLNEEVIAEAEHEAVIGDAGHEAVAADAGHQAVIGDARHEAARSGAEHEAGKDHLAASRTLRVKDAHDIATHLRELEETLEVLHACDTHHWSAAGSKAWRELRQMLSAIEGTTLVLWAMVAARTGCTNGKPWAEKDLREQRSSEQRADVIKRLQDDSLTPRAAVDFARSNDVWRTSRTRLNLACWYADMGMSSDALRELELGLECGGDLAGRRMRDPQLRKVCVERAEDWEKLVLRYMPSRAPTHENGHQTLEPAFHPSGRAPVSGPPGG
jgi:hypothetical protein